MTSAREYYRNHYVDQERRAVGPEEEATFELRMRAAQRAIGPVARQILDFGCGTGAAASVLAAAGHKVVGVDVSDTGLRVARRNARSATFVSIETESCLPFSDRAFDVCLCTEVLEHLVDVTGFIAEIHRVLDSNGLFIITVPFHGWVKNVLVVTLNFERHFDPTWGHIRFFSKRSLFQSLENGGFDIEQFQGIGRFWPVWKSMFVLARRCG